MLAEIVALKLNISHEGAEYDTVMLSDFLKVLLIGMPAKSLIVRAS